MQVLVIVAASHLDAVTFQICSQSFKIMPTAFFAVWLLGQYLTPLQWGSLPVLAVGVVFVTMNGSTPAGAPLPRQYTLTPRAYSRRIGYTDSAPGPQLVMPLCDFDYVVSGAATHIYARHAIVLLSPAACVQVEAA